MWPKSKRAAILQITENPGETSSFLWLMSVELHKGIGQFLRETCRRACSRRKRSLDAGDNLPACYRNHTSQSKT
jgi:hypothetical protein